jgi:hypothetical protein
MPFMSPDGRPPVNITTLLPSSNTTTEPTIPLSPPIQLAKLTNSPCPSRARTNVYSQEYAVFNGFFAVMIVLAIVFLLGVCAASYVARGWGDGDGAVELVDTDFERKVGDGRVLFPLRVWWRLGREKAKSGENHI